MPKQLVLRYIFKTLMFILPLLCPHRCHCPDDWESHTHTWLGSCTLGFGAFWDTHIKLQCWRSEWAPFSCGVGTKLWHVTGNCSWHKDHRQESCQNVPDTWGGSGDRTCEAGASATESSSIPKMFGFFQGQCLLYIVFVWVHFPSTH